MILSEVIQTLEGYDPDFTMKHGLSNPHPWHLDPYYLAFEPCDKPVTIGDLLDQARRRLTTFSTYDGTEGHFNGSSGVVVAENKDNCEGVGLTPFMLHCLITGTTVGFEGSLTQD